MYLLETIERSNTYQPIKIPKTDKGIRTARGKISGRRAERSRRAVAQEASGKEYDRLVGYDTYTQSTKCVAICMGERRGREEADYAAGTPLLLLLIHHHC